MAKRSRGSVRPGQRRPTARRTSTRPAAEAAPAPRPATGLTEAEAQRAAELEAQMLAEERAANEAARRGRERARQRVEVGPRSTGSLAHTAAEEYAYVARDVKRIARIAIGLVAVLVALWVFVTATGFGGF